MKYQIFRGKDKKWSWHLLASNGKDILAWSGQGDGYENFDDCCAGLARVKGSAECSVENLVSGEEIVILPDSN